MARQALFLSAVVILAAISAAGTLHEDLSLMSDRLERVFWYYVPDGLPAGDVPLVIVLHGGGGDCRGVTGSTIAKSPPAVWMDVADREGFIVAYPQGAHRASMLGGWHWNDCRGDVPDDATADDVLFIRDLIDWMSSEYPIDRQRVYATGISNGGMMSLRLAVELSDRIAAVGAVAACMAAVPDCGDPVHPISILLMNGTEDELVPFGGGPVLSDRNPRGTVVSTDSTLSFWRGFLQIDSEPVVRHLPDENTADGSTVTELVWAGGLEGTEVVLYRIDGGGHTEPSISQQRAPLYESLVGMQNHDIEAAEVLWDFFSRNTLDGEPPSMPRASR